MDRCEKLRTRILDQFNPAITSEAPIPKSMIYLKICLVTEWFTIESNRVRPCSDVQPAKSMPGNMLSDSIDQIPRDFSFSQRPNSILIKFRVILHLCHCSSFLASSASAPTVAEAASGDSRACSGSSSFFSQSLSFFFCFFPNAESFEPATSEAFDVDLFS